MSHADSADDEVSLDLRVTPIDDMPKYTRHVLAAVYSLVELDDRRASKTHIGERIDVDISRDKVTYRLRRLREERIVWKDSYQEHETMRHEYRLDTREAGPEAHDPDDVVADARACYGSVELLDIDEARDPSESTLIALSGRVRDAEARLDRLEEELDVDDGSVGLSDYI